MVEISSYNNYVSANIQLGLLKDAGITAFLEDEDVVTELGSVKLMVRNEDEELARKILANTVDEEGLAE